MKPNRSSGGGRSGRVRVEQSGQHAPDLPHLVVIDGAAQARIDPFRHVPAQSAQHLRGFVHPRQGDVGVDVAASTDRTFGIVALG
jgi:hypothetical protein